MSVTLAKKVPQRVEHTGNAPADRAQRMAQQVGQAHEITKNVVAALANAQFTSLTVDVTTSSTSFVDLMSLPITTSLATGHLEIHFTASFDVATAGSFGVFYIFVDGVAQKGVRAPVVAASGPGACAIVLFVAVKAGPHIVKVQWRTNTGAVTIHASTFVDEHASLLVKEAA